MGLPELLRRPEGKTFECKREITRPDGLWRTAVAFANTAGGTLLIGVDDTTHHVRGLARPQDVEERVASLLADGVEPRLLPDLDLLPWRDTHVLRVTIHPSNVRPHWVKAEGRRDGVYVRIGSTNRRADAAMITELVRFSQGGSFDEQPVPDVSRHNVPVAVVREAFRGRRSIAERDLVTLRLLVRHQGRTVPTAGGLLLFGRDRLERFPESFVQCARFAGTDRSRVVDSLRLHAELPSAIDEATQFVQRHLGVRFEIGGAARRREVVDVPPVAVREAVVNAIAHADYAAGAGPIRIAVYADRLEIENPGVLPFGLTLDDLPAGVSKLRNRVIGRVLHELGYAEQWGSGIQRMLDATSRAGAPPPRFEEIGVRFRVTLPFVPTASPDPAAASDGQAERLLDFLGDPPGKRTSDVARHLGVSVRTARNRLLALVEAGHAFELGSGPTDPRKRYVRAR